jgi:hypothetical protein
MGIPLVQTMKGERMQSSQLVLSVALVLVLGAGGNLAAQDEKPSGTISIQSQTISLGVGVDWGAGLLTLRNGDTYQFSLQGLEVGAVGVSEVRAEGEVYNLEKVSDFEGLYVAAKANIAVVRGPGARTMRNENGVVVHIDSVQKGAKLILAAEGVRINLLQQ